MINTSFIYRSLHGYNENPTQQQFMSSYRKLLVYSTICTSKVANCANFDAISEPVSNIVFVSSRRSRIEEAENYAPIPEELEDLHVRLDEIANMEQLGLISSNFSDDSVVHIANVIETRMKTADIYCKECMLAFEENVKVMGGYIGSNFQRNPCQSTVSICKMVDRFLKVQFLRNKLDFDRIYYIIADAIDVETLYNLTNFSHNLNHKLLLIRSIVDVYIQIKSTYLARKANFTGAQANLRAKLHKLIHFYGQ